MNAPVPPTDPPTDPPADPAAELAAYPLSRVPARLRWLALLRSRPRLWWSAAAGAAVGLAAGTGLVGTGMGGPRAAEGATAFLLGWNTFALMYLGLAWHLVRGGSHHDVRERASSQHEGRHVVLVLGVVAVLVALLAIASQLAAVRELHGLGRGRHLALAGLTVATSWLFTQTLFALYYAHDFYVARLRGGAEPLQFPQTPDPDYGDFFYFACVIGTSGQTADVAICSSRLRRIGTLHCVQAFVFNTTTLALGVNIAASLF